MEGGRRFKTTETMAVQSMTQSSPPPTSKASTRRLFENPMIPFAVALALADALLVSLIIAYVPCKFKASLSTSLGAGFA